ncbi:MAG TPA: hydroxymethylglutaryl-CoA reductase, degradative [Aggregatilineales bacterium]|nr:hydroxymethylglutaryl-CoA reductase, degradative [Aggregatilineales bacterium]
MNTQKTSRISQFYKKTITERLTIIREWLGKSADSPLPLDGGLSADQADAMIENVLGRYALPFAVATNFLINGRDILVPMVIEEPSVVAACSNAARLFRDGGGFTTSSDQPVMIGQIQVLDIPDMAHAIAQIEANKAMLLAEADSVGGSIVKRGGGARDIEIRVFDDTPIGAMLVLHLLLDTRDAMGANAINTAVEHLAPHVESLTGGRVNLRILSNLTDKRKARAEGVIPKDALATDSLTGEQVVKAIVEAGYFAEIDPYRATTHNKGVMNGIDAVVMATGNDWRAVESGAHAYVARDGRYTSMTQWRMTPNGDLHGMIELPLAVGIVGGATRVHPTAQLALDILGITTAQELAEIMVAVGLAQNFAAIRALATDGIQQGHMRMHAKQLALAAGATPEQAPKIAKMMIDEKNIRLERAKQLVESLLSEEKES